MGAVISFILDTVVKLIDKVPVLKGYRTAIFAFALGVLALLDHFGIGGGSLFAIASPIIIPVMTATALAHEASK